MRDLAFLGFLGALLALALKRPFLFVLAYAYVDIVAPQRLSYYLLNSVPGGLSTLMAALEQQRRRPAARIGALLVEGQGIAPAEVQRQLRFQVEETVFDLVRWRDGYFRFEETPPLDAGSIGIRVPSESLLMESMRRADEWMEMASGEADASLVPVLVERDLDPSGVLSLNPAAWQVLAAVDGAHTLREIAREIGRGEFDVAKAVFSLASDGVIELRTRPSASSGARQAQRSLEEEVALVEGELRAGRSDAALRRIDALAGSHPGSGAISLLRGRALPWAAQLQVPADVLMGETAVAGALSTMDSVLPSNLTVERVRRAMLANWHISDQFISVNMDRLRIIRSLIKHGADVNARNTDMEPRWSGARYRGEPQTPAPGYSPTR